MKPRYEVLGVKIVGGLREASTLWVGASLFVELFRSSGIDAVANKVLPAKGSAKGLKQGQTVESFVLLSALGGECVEDMQHPRDDDGLSGILGYRPCRQLLIGLESVLTGNLRGIDRNDWKSKQYDSYLSSIEIIQSHGISVNGCFILGLDSDDPGIFERTRDFIEKSQLVEAQITVLTPFPGTRLYQRLKTEGRLLNETYWDRCTLFDVNFVPKNISVEQLESGLAWLGSQIYSEEAFGRRKRHYKQLVRDLT